MEQAIQVMLAYRHTVMAHDHICHYCGREYTCWRIWCEDKKCQLCGKHPGLVRGIYEGLRDLRLGRTISLEELKAELES